MNCLFGALAIKRRLGGKICWRPGWRQSGGWYSFLGSPWGHFGVRFPNGTVLSYSSPNKDISVWNQLWYQGYVRRRR